VRNIKSGKMRNSSLILETKSSDEKTEGFHFFCH